MFLINNNQYIELTFTAYFVIKKIILVFQLNQHLITIKVLVLILFEGKLPNISKHITLYIFTFHYALTFTLRTVLCVRHSLTAYQVTQSILVIQNSYLEYDKVVQKNWIDKWKTCSHAHSMFKRVLTNIIHAWTKTRKFWKIHTKGHVNCNPYRCVDEPSISDF